MLQINDVDTVFASIGPDEQFCPMCSGYGVMTEDCKRCTGQGDMLPYSNDGCAECDCTGEVISGVCLLCEQKGKITKALARIYKGYKQVTDNNPTWDKTTEPGGVTAYSLALYFLHRIELQYECVHIVGSTEKPEFYSNIVEFLDQSGKILLHLTGFAWGYTGEGPNGLAAVLRDVWPDESLAGKRAVPHNTPMEQGWDIRKTTF